MTAPPARNWYVQTEDQQSSGPFSDAELRHMFQSENIDEHALVWCEELDGWEPLAHYANALKLHEPVTATPAAFGYHQTAAPVISQRQPQAITDLTDNQKTPSPPAIEIRDEDMYASLGKRFIAFCIDVFIITVAILIVGLLLRTIALEVLASAFKVGSLLSATVINILSIGYFAWFHNQYRATPGKMFMEIELADTDGERLGLLTCLLHSVAFLLLSNLLTFIHTVIIPFTTKKQGLHDMLCKTVVLNKNALIEMQEKKL